VGGGGSRYRHPRIAPVTADLAVAWATDGLDHSKLGCFGVPGRPQAHHGVGVIGHPAGAGQSRLGCVRALVGPVATD
jgi:hypothetical protein